MEKAQKPPRVRKRMHNPELEHALAMAHSFCREMEKAQGYGGNPAQIAAWKLKDALGTSKEKKYSVAMEWAYIAAGIAAKEHRLSLAQRQKMQTLLSEAKIANMGRILEHAISDLAHIGMVDAQKCGMEKAHGK